MGEVPLRLRGLLLATHDEEKGYDEREEAVHGMRGSFLRNRSGQKYRKNRNGRFFLPLS